MFKAYYHTPFTQGQNYIKYGISSDPDNARKNQYEGYSGIRKCEHYPRLQKIPQENLKEKKCQAARITTNNNL